MCLCQLTGNTTNLGCARKCKVLESFNLVLVPHWCVPRHTGGSTSRKILRFVDKIAKSKYFQKATENEYIRKKIAEVSNMPLMLSVEVLELSGTLAINIPPPPTDRIWYWVSLFVISYHKLFFLSASHNLFLSFWLHRYSFRVPPRLDLHVRPTLGEREVTFTHVTEWIEKKLQCEFQVSETFSTPLRPVRPRF